MSVQNAGAVLVVNKWNQNEIMNMKMLVNEVYYAYIKGTIMSQILLGKTLKDVDSMASFLSVAINTTWAFYLLSLEVNIWEGLSWAQSRQNICPVPFYLSFLPHWFVIDYSSGFGSIHIRWRAFLLYVFDTLKPNTVRLMLHLIHMSISVYPSTSQLHYLPVWDFQVS